MSSDEIMTASLAVPAAPAPAASDGAAQAAPSAEGAPVRKRRTAAAAGVSSEEASEKPARARRPRTAKKPAEASEDASRSDAPAHPSAKASSADTPADPAAAAPADGASAPEKPARAKRALRTRKSSSEAEKVSEGSEGANAPAPEAAAEDVKPGRANRTPRQRASKQVKAEAGESTDAPQDAVSPAAAEQEPAKKEAAQDEPKRSDAEKPEKRERFERFDRQDRQDRKNGKGGKSNSKQRDQRGGQRQNQNQGQGQDHRRQRRSHVGGGNREPIVPKTTAEDLNALKVAELRAKADELGVDSKGLKKAELVERVLEASVRAEGFIEVTGVLDIMQDGYGFLRTGGYLPGENDVYVGLSLIRRNGLRKGDFIRGQIRPKRDNEKFAALQQIATVNDVPLDQLGQRVRFGDLTPIYPDDCLIMEHGKSTITARVIDLVAPIGKGQRGLIVSPPKAGKTTILKDIAAAITANNPEVHLMCLLVDERPEEVTDMERSIRGEVISSTFDMPTENHITVAELVIERAKRLVECGKDVVILLDSLTRLARAYNLAQPASGRILSGGVDSTALYPPKRFLGAARNIEGGGSLTILASALIETGSKMDEVIFEEFKGTGNMELKLDRYLADRRIFPAIDPVASGTRKEDLLLNPQEAPLIWAVRRILSNMNNTERAMDMLIKSLKQTNTNQEFLLRTAKKAQASRDSDNFEF